MHAVSMIFKDTETEGSTTDTNSPRHTGTHRGRPKSRICKDQIQQAHLDDRAILLVHRTFTTIVPIKATYHNSASPLPSLAARPDMYPGKAGTPRSRKRTNSNSSAQIIWTILGQSHSTRIADQVNSPMARARRR